MKSKFRKMVESAIYYIVSAFIITAGFLFALAVGALLIGAFTALAAVVIWALWNFVAPQFAFIPLPYQNLQFTTVWGALVLLAFIRNAVFGSKKGSK